MGFQKKPFSLIGVQTDNALTGMLFWGYTLIVGLGGGFLCLGLGLLLFEGWLPDLIGHGLSMVVVFGFAAVIWAFIYLFGLYLVFKAYRYVFGWHTMGTEDDSRVF